MSTSACSKLLSTLSGTGVPSERLPLQNKHQWLILVVNATGDGRSLWYNDKMSDLGSLSMATNGINDKMSVVGSSIFRGMFYKILKNCICLGSSYGCSFIQLLLYQSSH